MNHKQYDHPRQAPTSGYLNMFIEVMVLIAIIFLVRTFFIGLYQVPTGSMETTMLVGERFFADKLSYFFVKPKVHEVIAFNDPTFPYSSNPFVRLWQNYVWGPSNWTKRIIAGPHQVIQGVIEEGKPVIYVDGKKIDEPYLNKYPLVAVYEKDVDAVRQEARDQALTYVAHNQLPRAAVDTFIQEQMRCSARWKSYDPQKPYNEQPFYEIDPSRVRLVNGEPVLRWPGTPLERLPYIREVRKGTNYWNGTDEFYVALKENEYWVMGDNREGSSDSRFFGPLDGRLIHGRILFLIWSNDSNEAWWIMDLIKHPIDFWKRMRWSRCLRWVR
jgi:signal peptidase I